MRWRRSGVVGLVEWLLAVREDKSSSRNSEVEDVAEDAAHDGWDPHGGFGGTGSLSGKSVSVRNMA